MIRLLLAFTLFGALALFYYHPWRQKVNLLQSPMTTSSWFLFQVPKLGVGKLTVDHDTLRCDMLNPTDNVGGLQLYQSNIALVAGHEYHIGFTAKADRPLKFELVAEPTMGSATKANMGLSTVVEVPQEWKTFDFYFKPTNVDGSPDKVPQFNLGSAAGTLWLKDMTLEEEHKPGFTSSLPRPKTMLASAR